MTKRPDRTRKLRFKIAGGTLAAVGALALAIPAVAAQETDDTTPTDETPTQEAPAPDEGTPGTPPEGEEGPRGHCGGHHLETVADVIGIEPEALREQLEAGASMAEVGQLNGVDTATVVDAIVADINTRLDEGVESGRLTAEEADEKRADAETKAEEIVNRPGDERPERPEGAPSPDGAPEETSTS